MFKSILHKKFKRIAENALYVLAAQPKPTASITEPTSFQIPIIYAIFPYLGKSQSISFQRHSQ